MVKLTNQEVYALFNKSNKEEQSAIEIFFNLDLPAEYAYKLKKAIIEIEKEYIAIASSREKLIKKYGVVDEDSQTMTVRDEKIEEYTAEFTPILEKEIDIDIEPLSISELGTQKISARILNLAEKLITE